jgi:hypothetical protein
MRGPDKSAYTSGTALTAGIGPNDFKKRNSSVLEDSVVESENLVRGYCEQ